MAISIQNVIDTQGQHRVANVGPIPVDPCSNYSYAFGYTGSNVTTIDKSKDGLTWRKTLTYSGDNVTAISAWVAL